MKKRMSMPGILALSVCAFGVLAALNPAWADTTVHNCAQVTATTEGDTDSTPNNKLDNAAILAAVTGGTHEDDEACIGLTVEQIYDYGDAPDSYGTLAASSGAVHEIIPGLSLGALVDEDDGTLTNADANADDNDGESDEDGYSVNTFTEGQDLDWDVSVVNETGAAANLVCWIDYNGDGVFATDGSESGSAVVSSAAGAQTIAVDMPQVPATAVADNLDATSGLSESYTRCRLSTDTNLTELTPSGALLNGEVEDRKITFVESAVFDLALRKTVTNPAANVQVGSTVSFNIEVMNQGTIDATGIVVTDYIPVGMELDPSETNWTVDPSNTQIATLNTPVALAAGQALNPVLTIKLRVVAGATTGDLTNTAEISAALDGNGDPIADRDSFPDANNANDGVVDDDEIDNDNNDEDDHDIAVVTVLPTVDISLVKTVMLADGVTPATTVRRGDTLIYVLTATNDGPDNATGITVTDQLPAGLTYVTDDTGGTAYDLASGVWTVGALNNGASKSLNITVTVN